MQKKNKYDELPPQKLIFEAQLLIVHSIISIKHVVFALEAKKYSTRLRIYEDVQRT